MVHYSREDSCVGNSLTRHSSDNQVLFSGRGFVQDCRGWSRLRSRSATRRAIIVFMSGHEILDLVNKKGSVFGNLVPGKQYHCLGLTMSFNHHVRDSNGVAKRRHFCMCFVATRNVSKYSRESRMPRGSPWGLLFFGHLINLP
jgi:hypothetical protein